MTNELLALALAAALCAPVRADDHGQEREATVPLARVELAADVAWAMAPQRRAAAAQRLRAGLAGQPSFEALVDAGEGAVRELVQGTTARLVERTVLAARWRALADREAAARWLAERLAALVQDLEFEPYLEAELPAGFPGPAPVHEVLLVRYPAYRMATAPMSGGRQNGAFWTLFEHITTNDIPMTAPVETTFEGDARRLVPTTMAFLYEGPEQGRAGQDGRVDVVDAAPQWVVTVALRGNDTRSRVDAAHAALLEWVAARPELEAAGPLRTMGYNSPMVRGSRRTFEVQLPVRLKVVAGV